MPTARTPEEAAQISKDRKALLRGALVAGAGLYGGYRLLKKSAGPVVGGTPWVPSAAKAKPLRKGDHVQANALRKGKTAQGAMDRQIRAAEIRQKRGWDAMRPASAKKLSKLTPDGRQKFGRMVGEARTASDVRLTPEQKAQMTSKEIFRRDRAARMAKRQEVAKFRRTKGFEKMGDGGWEMVDENRRSFAALLRNLPSAIRHLQEQRDRMDSVRDGAVAAGALASGGAAVYGAREWAKTNRVAQGAVKQIVPKLDPKEIVREGVNQIGSKAKRKAKEYFPTFIKGGKAVSRVLKKKIFATPADGLIDFAGQEQWKDPDDRTYNNPLRVAAGMQHGYYRTTKDGTPIVEDLPLAHSQTIKAALNKGKVIHRTAKRTGSLAKDVVDTARGKPRGKDAAGRTKKREWEKSWFRNKVGEVATGAALLGGAAYLRKSPKGRAAVARGEKWAVKQARRVNPDAFPKGRVFATPADRLIDFARKPVDPKEEKKIERSARIRNALVGAAAGSFLGGGLYGGKSGYDGARWGAAMGGLYGAASNPKRRAAVEQLQVAAFATPADRLVEFDAVANDAGWDIRDPRGKSARVFAPGSRRRQRREKDWHEKVDNERKLWKTGLLAASLVSAGAGVAATRAVMKKSNAAATAAAVEKAVKSVRPTVRPGPAIRRPGVHPMRAAAQQAQAAKKTVQFPLKKSG